MDSDNGKHRCFQSRNVRPAPALCSRMLKDRLLTTCAILLQMGLNWNAVSRWRRFKTGQSSTARQPLADDIRYYIIFVFFVHVSRRPSPVFSPCCWPSPSNEMTDGHFSYCVYSYVGKWPKAVYISVARRRQAPETIPYITCRLGRVHRS